jgi:hypothetical protein
MIVVTPLLIYLVPHKNSDMPKLSLFFEAKKMLLQTVLDDPIKRNSKVIDVMTVNKLFIQKQRNNNVVFGLISGVYNEHYLEVLKNNLLLIIIKFFPLTVLTIYLFRLFITME